MHKVQKILSVKKKSANEPKHSEIIRLSQFTTDPNLPTLPYVLKFGAKSVRVGSCGVKKCGAMTPVTIASATSLVESGLVSVNLKGPWKSRRIYPKYMPKCSVAFTDHVYNFFAQKY